MDRGDVLVCGNGIPSSAIESLVSASPVMASPEDKVLHLLFLSNLLISKGVVVLLDSLKVLKEKGCRFVSDFVGGETVEMDAAMFQAEVVKRGLKGMVVYHGKKYGKDKEAFLNGADIFVFPTFYHNECFPLVLLEAMEHGWLVSRRQKGEYQELLMMVRRASLFLSMMLLCLLTRFSFS